MRAKPIVGPAMQRRAFIALTTAAVCAPAIGQTPALDTSGRQVKITPSTRLVTIGGDITEIVYALGFGAQIVAADRNSKYPVDVQAKPNVGGRTQLSAEGVMATRPDLILMAQDSGPPDTIDVLKSAGASMVLVPNKYTTAGLGEKIELISRILGREREGKEMTAKISARLEALKRATSAVPPALRKRVLFTHSITGGRVSAAAGLNTPADAIITAAGGVNAMSAMTGVKPASAEAIVAAAPDVILLARNSDGSAPTIDEVFAVPAFQGTPAFRSRAYVLLEGPFMLGFGPRTADAIEDLARTLYPQLNIPGQ